MRHRSPGSRISARGRAAVTNEGYKLSDIGTKVDYRTIQQVVGFLLIDKFVFVVRVLGQTTSNGDVVAVQRGWRITPLACARGLGLARSQSRRNQNTR